MERYRALLDAIGCIPSTSGRRASAPYNLLVTRDWMLLVPRVVSQVEGVAVNALGFAGSLFVRDEAQMRTVERSGR